MVVLSRIIIGAVGFGMIFSQVGDSMESHLIAGAGGIIIALTYGLIREYN
jgi:hypothetical protein